MKLFSAASFLLIGTLAAAAPISVWLVDASRISKGPVRYAPSSELKQFPVPVLHWRRAGLVGSEADVEEIKSKIIYPAILESRKPVVAMVVELGQADRNSIGLTALFADGEARETLISKGANGHFDANAYKVLFARPVP